jgi:hypothetical protein
MLFLQIARARNQPVMFIGYSVLIFFVLSCLWSYAGLQEKFKAENTAHRHQYDNTIPKDCDYNNLGFKDSIEYFFRVKLLHCKSKAFFRLNYVQFYASEFIMLKIIHFYQTMIDVKPTTGIT